MPHMQAIVHVIDNVLVPDDVLPRTLVSPPQYPTLAGAIDALATGTPLTAVAGPQAAGWKLSVLRAALQAAGLFESFKDPKKSITLFAPTDRVCVAQP